MALSDLVNGSEIRTNVIFAIACFCCLFGFLTAIFMYVYYGYWTQKDMTGGIQALTYIFISQGFGGMIVSLFNKSGS